MKLPTPSAQATAERAPQRSARRRTLTRSSLRGRAAVGTVDSLSDMATSSIAETVSLYSDLEDAASLYASHVRCLLPVLTDTSRRPQVTKQMSILYKYLPLERQSFLTDGLLRFSQPGALNDPFECFPALPRAVAEEGLAHIRKTLLEPPPNHQGTPREERRKLNRDYLKRARQKLRELPSAGQLRRIFLEKGQANIDSKLGILSLSRRWNSSLMWAHYTSSHTGFCVGFERNHDFFQQANRRKDGEFFCAPVHYSNKRPTIEFRPLAPFDAYAFLLTKSSDWKYEEEERAIALLSLADKTFNAAPLPVALFKIPNDAIVEVIVGLRAPENLIKESRAFCSTQGIPLYRISISESAYDFERERVEV